jgi:hypothetical protein
MDGSGIWRNLAGPVGGASTEEVVLPLITVLGGRGEYTAEKSHWWMRNSVRH